MSDISIDLDYFLRKMVELKASDGFITKGAPLSLKINGSLTPLNEDNLSSDGVEVLLASLMTVEQKQDFIKNKELDFAIQKIGIGRFRVSAFQQKLEYGAVIRRIEAEIPELDNLGTPEELKNLSLLQRGLILIVGATGSGKSTTLAAMLGHRNQNTKGHIVTVEDPIEFVHEHQSCIITQREVGIDTPSFEAALKSCLRQAPDVILIGEIRNQETMRYAMSFAETGHLCLATLHANNANQALDRISHLYPKDLHRQMWLELSLNLRAIVAQQLIPNAAGTGRVPVLEVLLNTPTIADHIHKGEVDLLKPFMAKGRDLGMQTFDQALFERYTKGDISAQSALKYADSENDIRLLIKLHTAAVQANSPKIASTKAQYDIDDSFRK